MKITTVTHKETGQIVAISFPEGSKLGDAGLLLSADEVDVFRGRDGYVVMEGEVVESQV